jgi:hypothetical protein
MAIKSCQNCGNYVYDGEAVDDCLKCVGGNFAGWRPMEPVAASPRAVRTL